MAGGRGNRGNQNQGVNQQVRQSFTDLKTAADMLKTTSTNMNLAMTQMKTFSDHNQKSIDALVSLVSSAIVPGSSGVLSGGTLKAGIPSAQAGYQPARSPWGSGGYPGGSGYGMGFQGGSGVSTHGGGLGAIRNAVARVHQQAGTGGYTYKSAGSDSRGALFTAHDSAGNQVGDAAPMDELNARVGNSNRGMLSSALGQRHGLGGNVGGFKSVAQGMATKGGKIGALGELGVAGAEALEGPVGWGLLAGQAVYQGANFVAGKVTDQRAQNAEYQSIYGGTNLGGMRQRFDQAGYTMSQLFSGGMGPAASAQAFKGVSAMGYGGTQRQQSLDFISSNYKSMGMSVNDSMQLIQVSSKNLTTSLGDLHTQLQQVTKSANAAGQSAQVLRAAFTQNLAATSGAGAGLGSGALAQGLTATSGPSQGRQFADTSTTPMISTLQQQAITGIYAGYSNPGQFMAAVGKDPMVGATAIQNRTGSMLTATVPPDVRAKVEAEIKKRGGPLIFNESGGQNIAMEVGSDPDIGLTQISAQGLDKILNAYGVAHNANNSQEMYGLLVIQIAQHMAGSPTSVTAQTQKAIDANKQQSNVKPPNATTDSQQAAVNNAQGTPNTPTTGANGTSWKPGGSKQNVGLDYNMVNGQYVKDPLVTKLLADKGIKGIQVQTGDGPQVVSVSEAVQKYRKQILDGSALVVGGQHSGGSVGSGYGSDKAAAGQLADDTTVKDPKNYAFGKNQKAIMAMGLSDDELAEVLSVGSDPKKELKKAKDIKSGKDKATTAAGSIVLSMTPDLARWIGVSPSGNVSTQVAQNGAPAALNPGGASTNTTVGGP